MDNIFFEDITDEKQSIDFIDNLDNIMFGGYPRNSSNSSKSDNGNSSSNEGNASSSSNEGNHDIRNNGYTTVEPDHNSYISESESENESESKIESNSESESSNNFLNFNRYLSELKSSIIKKSDYVNPISNLETEALASVERTLTINDINKIDIWKKIFKHKLLFFTFINKNMKFGYDSDVSKDYFYNEDSDPFTPEELEFTGKPEAIYKTDVITKIELFRENDDTPNVVNTVNITHDLSKESINEYLKNNLFKVQINVLDTLKQNKEPLSDDNDYKLKLSLDGDQEQKTIFCKRGNININKIKFTFSTLPNVPLIQEEEKETKYHVVTYQNNILIKKLINHLKRPKFNNVISKLESPSDTKLEELLEEQMSDFKFNVVLKEKETLSVDYSKILGEIEKILNESDSNSNSDEN